MSPEEFRIAEQCALLLEQMRKEKEIESCTSDERLAVLHGELERINLAIAQSLN